jgi:hypothetical protein
MSLRSSSLWRPSSPISPTPATAAGPTLLLGWGAPGLHTNSITPEKVEGLLLIRMRFEEPALNSPAAVGRACIRAEGVLIALYSIVVAVEGEWGAGEEGAFAALRQQLGEEEGTASGFEPCRRRWAARLLLGRERQAVTCSAAVEVLAAAASRWVREREPAAMATAWAVTAAATAAVSSAGRGCWVKGVAEVVFEGGGGGRREDLSG